MINPAPCTYEAWLDILHDEVRDYLDHRHCYAPEVERERLEEIHSIDARLKKAQEQEQWRQAA